MTTEQLTGNRVRTLCFLSVTRNEWLSTGLLAGLLALPCVSPAADELATTFGSPPMASAPAVYPDGRPSARLRLDATDQGRILKHGDGPKQCDLLGAREALIFKEGGTYHLFYDGAGPKGWLACLATSKDLETWQKKGPVLEFGKAGEMDSAAACAPWVFHDGKEWHMFYLGTQRASGAPDRIPSTPYVTMKATTLPLLLSVLCAASLPLQAAPDSLVENFMTPPAAARPGVYWYFMDGNLNGTEMTADLESMKTAGLGNLVFLEVDVEVPAGPVKFMSEPWQELFAKAVHAAERLGLDISLGTGPGWCGSGGPWVKPEQSMQHLVFSTVAVEGPVLYEAVLPVPEQRETFRQPGEKTTSSSFRSNRMT